jgi:hypothetical protein
MIRPRAAAPFEWREIAHSDAGFDSDLDSRFDKLIAGKRAWGLHGLLVARGGRVRDDLLLAALIGQESSFADV